MEKSQFVNFIGNILKKSGFKVYKDFKTFQRVIDIYAVLPTVMGDFTIVVACKNYDEHWEVGLDILKEMEMVGNSLKASKVVIATSSSFSAQSKRYASEKKIELLDRNDLIKIAGEISKEHSQSYNSENEDNNDKASEKLENSYDNPNTNQSPKYDSYHENSYETDLNSHYNSQHYSKQNRSEIKHFNSTGRGSSKGNKKLTPHPPSGNNRKKFKNISRSRISKNQEEPNKTLGAKIKIIFNNIIVLILFVVAITYLLSFTIDKLTDISVGIQGLIKIFSSLILSYGLVFVMDHKGTAILSKGTIVFFASFIISILMTLLL